MYSLLKDKYGAELVQNWCEKTDPHKFVYEDIAIAAYLLLLWEDDRKRIGSERKQSFVDLGCGNGLLVYILTREGHKGLGIDLRRRNIWDTYGSDVKLEAENLFPDYDWLIGNHSDELTPWIPVMAARSSYSCNYFVLPCCHHDFNQRFSSKAKGLSQYRTYLTYVAQVSEVCGFQVEEDTLRIPSTKRVCHIGRHRTYAAEQEAEMDKRRQEFIQSRCATKPTKARHTETQGSEIPAWTKPKKLIMELKFLKSDYAKKKDSDSQQDGRREGDFVSKDSDSQQDGRREGDFVSKGSDNSGGDMKSEKTVDVWAENFQARESVERVRKLPTCRLGPQRIKWCALCFDLVLNADDASVAVTHDWKSVEKRSFQVVFHWVSFAQKLDKATREELKSECGGVQTLLRNHNYIFQVSGGKVHLRDFSIDNPWSKHVKAKSRKVDAASHHKTTLCWFHDNHPDGCPRRAENCTFAHGTQELKPRDQSK
ncbi:hypothetical protein BaRGS_00033706 [Batillaria attramentaria]|uniref:tRNA (uracil-O(2)-)-methyltransferase n=1 Tax=Batillaria attramentaria TaxID=370345 RepID=A0ABD0JJB4_9CAEN